MTEVLVFSPHRTPRFLYTLHWVLTYRLGLEPTITDSEQEFESSTLPRINYSSLQFANCFNIEAGTLLFDTAINENFGEIGSYKGLKTLFHSSRGELPFDIFGAVFYCLSRMAVSYIQALSCISWVCSIRPSLIYGWPNLKRNY